MLILPGSTSLSHFANQKLLDACQELALPVTSINAQYVHFVKVDEPLSQAQQDVLNKLLTYGPAREEVTPADEAKFPAARPGRRQPTPRSQPGADNADHQPQSD